jgi:hypothetical protein
MMLAFSLGMLVEEAGALSKSKADLDRTAESAPQLRGTGRTPIRRATAAISSSR